MEPLVLPVSESHETLEQQLITMASDMLWLMHALRAGRSLGQPSWCIGAGAVRNLVWDSLHQTRSPSALPDVDVVYHDETDLSAEGERRLQKRLAAWLPDVPWEVTNQARVHEWYERQFGQAVAPLRSLEEAVASWPEYTTCVGLHLRTDDSLQVIAPHGLQDLFAMVVRHNPTRVGVDTYLARVRQKRYTERWPMVKVVTPC